MLTRIESGSRKCAKTRVCSTGTTNDEPSFMMTSIEDNLSAIQDLFSTNYAQRGQRSGMAGARMASDVPAVLSAVRLLERIARDWPEPVPSGVLIEDLGLNRSTCYNLLGTLQRAGWVTSHGDRGGWTLGPRLLATARVSEDWMSEIV